MNKPVTTWLVILLAAAAPAAAFLFPAAARAEGEFAVKLGISTDSIAAGDPVYLSLEIENKSDKPIRVPAHFLGPGATDGAGLFFAVVGENGEALSPTCKPANPSPAGAVININPGDYHGMKKYRLTDCYAFSRPGEYTIAAQFSSASKTEGVWKGTAASNAVKLKVKDSEPMKRTRVADALISQWLANYDYAAAPGYKQKLLSLGLPAAPAIVTALRTERRMLPVNDLLELLGQLSCRESVEALVNFISTAKNLKFTSNMPDEFSSASLLVETAIRSLEKLSGEKFDSEKGDVIVRWQDWMKKDLETFPSALPGLPKQ